jgi:potassium/hydrogen antiporter
MTPPGARLAKIPRMSEIHDFAVLVLIASGGLLLALFASKLTELAPVPAPALFLIAAALASDLFPGLADEVSIRTVERVGVVALIVILLDGGMRIGRRRFREAIVPIASLGVLGTFATAALIALFAHALFDFDWTTAGIIGAALAPTDPAVMFSVLGNREVAGRTGTILEGESGANDPVGIALMIGLLEFATHDDASAWSIVWEFAREMAVGLGVGVAGAVLLLPILRRVSLPDVGLYPLRVLLAAGVVYGVASLLEGSGFLAVFVTGLLIGDEDVPHGEEVERFHTVLSSLAEIVVFIALGLTVDLSDLFSEGHWLEGIVLAVLLALVARPIVAGLLLLPVRLRPGERLFVMWGGLKGAVPILLAALVVLAGIEDSGRIYDIVFVVVVFSVVVQGSTIPFAAARCRVPMRRV